MPEVVASSAQEAAAAVLRGTVVLFKSPGSKGLFERKAYALLWNAEQKRLVEFYEGDAGLSPTSFVALERRVNGADLDQDYSQLPWRLRSLITEYAKVSLTDRFDDQAFANYLICQDTLDI